MNTVAAILTSVQLLVHTLGGCCWHHEHGAVPTESLSLAIDLVAEDNCCLHRQNDQAETPGDEGEQRDGTPATCSEPSCVFIKAGDVDDLRQTSEFAALSVAAVESTAVATLDQSIGNYLLEHDLGPPLRLHALHQVLLI